MIHTQLELTFSSPLVYRTSTRSGLACKKGHELTCYLSRSRIQAGWTQNLCKLGGAGFLLCVIRELNLIMIKDNSWICGVEPYLPLQRRT